MHGKARVRARLPKSKSSKGNSSGKKRQKAMPIKRCHENISILLYLQSGMSNNEFWKKDEAYLRRLWLILSSNKNDAIFNAEFPPEDVHTFQGEDGKPLAYTQGGQRNSLRYRVIPNCAVKVLDIIKSKAGVEKLAALRDESPNALILYDHLFREASSIQSGKEASLREFLDGRLELKLEKK